MITSPFSLIGKKILVTGASSGIGKQVVITLSNMGAYVILNARNIRRLEEVQDLIGRDKSSIVFGDLTKENTIDKIINSIDKLDGIVNAAGIMELLPFKFIKKDTLTGMMDVNFFAPVNLTLELFKKKKISKGASIVFITSINGSIVGSKANSMYAASKGALSGIVKAMALDLSKNKIRVNEIVPGMIQTEGVNSVKDSVSKTGIEQDVLKYPLGCYGTPNDVANGCVYLLSEASQWVTGSKLVIDGGFTAQ